MKKTIIVILISTSTAFSQGVLDTATAYTIRKSGWLEEQSYPGIYEVSLIQLIANPEHYNGKRVMVSGYLHLQFEGNAIYLSKTDYDMRFAKNGIWIGLNEYVRRNSQTSDFSDQYVRLIGIFNSKSKGHEGAWSGSIDDVYSIEVIKKD